MTFVLGTFDIADAIRDHMKAMDPRPSLVEIGDLAYWSEETGDADLPAVFVRLTQGANALQDSGHTFGATHEVRVVFVGSYGATEKRTEVKHRMVDAIAAHLMPAGSTPKLGIGQISGLESITGWVTGYDLEPAEDQQVAMQGDRRLFAVEVRGVVNAFAKRC